MVTTMAPGVTQRAISKRWWPCGVTDYILFFEEDEVWVVLCFRERNRGLRIGFDKKKKKGKEIFHGPSDVQGMGLRLFFVEEGEHGNGLW